MELVLDDQIRRAKPLTLDNPGGRRAALHAVAWLLPIETFQVFSQVAVPFAALGDSAEQCCCFTFPGELRELVDSGDHQRRRESVDLLINDQDRQPFLVRRQQKAASLTERAFRLWADHQRAPVDGLNGDVTPGLDAGAAPWAGRQLVGGT